MRLRSCGTVVGLLALTACQPLPHPFETNHDAPTALLLASPEVVGIVVDPVRGLDTAPAAALQEGLAKALRDADIPASASAGGGHSYHVAGKLDGPVGGGDPVAVTIDWSVLSAAGDELGRDAQKLVLAQADWASGGSGIAAAMPAEAAQIAEILHLPAAAPPAPPPPPPSPPLRAAILPAIGAPGDGDRSLPRALAYILQDGGVAVLDQPDTGAALVSARVSIKPAPAGRQDIRIVWTVTTAAHRQIGTVSQENIVPGGSLDGPWGDTAAMVAAAAGDAIHGLIDQAMQADQPPP
jgi:hypothetical protein